MAAKSQNGLQGMMDDSLDSTSREYGMRINIQKTELLKISKGKEAIVRINIGGKEIEEINEILLPREYNYDRCQMPQRI